MILQIHTGYGTIGLSSPVILQAKLVVACISNRLEAEVRDTINDTDDEIMDEIDGRLS